MRIGIKYLSFYDCSGLIYTLSEGSISYLKHKVFSIKYRNNEYLFSRTFDDLKDVDKTIICINHLQQAKDVVIEANNLKLTNFKLLQMQIVENFQCSDSEIVDFLNKGNIILSSASVNFTHENLIYDPFLNLFYLYRSCGFNYINYHKNSTKKFLMGIYYRPIHVDGIVRRERKYIYEKAKQLLDNNLICYTTNNKTEFDILLENHEGFGFWNQTYISTYTDYSTSVCNIMFETLGSTTQTQDPNHFMYNREYITEKTLQSLLYSKENIFFIWYGPKKILKILKDMGFWFLNLEFYDENDDSIIKDEIYLCSVYNSIVKSIEYIKKLKTELKDNNFVFEHLIDKYGHHLANNSVLLDNVLNQSIYKEKILQLIEK